jgi:hypothetical protein
MDKDHWRELAALLQRGHLEFDPGLTDLEVETTEKKFNFRFPPDLRAFLQTVMPAHIGFHDWRDGSEAWLRGMLDAPLRDYLAYIENDSFWLPEWGPKPELLSDAREIVKSKIAEAPKLIPIYGNCFMSEEPRESGNPVIGVSQMDIVYVGFDLDDYLRYQFDLPRREWPAQVRPIRFWDPDRFQKLLWG